MGKARAKQTSGIPRGPRFRPRFLGWSDAPEATQASGVPRMAKVWTEVLGVDRGARGHSGEWRARESRGLDRGLDRGFWGWSDAPEATQASGVHGKAEVWTEVSTEVLGVERDARGHSGEWRAQESRGLDRGFDRGFGGGARRKRPLRRVACPGWDAALGEFWANIDAVSLSRYFTRQWVRPDIIRKEMTKGDRYDQGKQA